MEKNEFTKKVLERSRSLFLDKLRAATVIGKKVLIFDTSLEQNLHVPTATRGIFFLVSFALFLAFITLLSLKAVDDRAPGLVYDMTWSIRTFFDMTGFKNAASSRDQVVAFLLNSTTMNFLTSKVFFEYNMIMGPIEIQVHRAPSTLCRPLGLPYAVDCYNEFKLGKSELTESFTGNASNLTFVYQEDKPLCVLGWCAAPVMSVVRKDVVEYPHGGVSVLLLNGTLYNGFGDIYLNDSEPVQWNSTTAPLILSDLFNDNIRALFVELTILNPSLSAVTHVRLMFEMLASGSVSSFLDVRCVSTGGSIHDFSSFYILVYPLISLLIHLTKFIRGFFSKECVACSKHVLVFNCVKCNCANDLAMDVTVCDRCGTPIPRLEHRCWRMALSDPFYLLSLGGMCFLIASRLMTMILIPQFLDNVDEALSVVAGANKIAVIRFGQITSLLSTALNIITVSIVLAYIQLFLYVCRGRINSRFVRVFRFGLPPLLLFTMNFMITYSGFCFALHILGGSSSESFSTTAGTYLISFRSLLTAVEWSELGQDKSPFFLLVFALFILVCAHLMFNVFPSVLTVAYKKAMNSPYYDTDVLSLWFLIKPVLKSAGILHDKRKSNDDELEFVDNLADENLDATEIEPALKKTVAKQVSPLETLLKSQLEEASNSFDEISENVASLRKKIAAEYQAMRKTAQTLQQALAAMAVHSATTKTHHFVKKKGALLEAPLLVAEETPSLSFQPSSSEDEQEMVTIGKQNDL